MNTIQFSRNQRFDKVARIFMMVAGGFLMLIIFALIFGFILRFLWNATVVEMFSFPTISYWQAIGLFILAKFFFGFGHGWGQQHYNKQQHEKWQQWCGQKSEHEPGQADDMMLQKYWEEEGKDAYEAFLASQKQGQQDEPDT